MDSFIQNKKINHLKFTSVKDKLCDDGWQRCRDDSVLAAASLSDGDGGHYRTGCSDPSVIGRPDAPDPLTNRWAASALPNIKPEAAGKRGGLITESIMGRRTEIVLDDLLLTWMMQEDLCCSVSLNACRMMQVPSVLTSSRLWKRTLTLSLSAPASSLSRSTFPDSREACTDGDPSRKGSDTSCGRRLEGWR